MHPGPPSDQHIEKLADSPGANIEESVRGTWRVPEAARLAGRSTDVSTHEYPGFANELPAQYWMIDKRAEIP